MKKKPTYRDFQKLFRKYFYIVVFFILISPINSSERQDYFDWIRIQQDLKNTNQIFYKKEFQELLKKNIPNKSYYFGSTNKNQKETVLEAFSKVLSGPPNKIIFQGNNNRYVILSACRQHSCDEKGFLWIDTEKKILTGIIIHYFFDDAPYDKRGYAFMFTNRPVKFVGRPDEFSAEVKNWTENTSKVIPSVIRFLNSKGDLEIINNSYYKDKHDEFIKQLRK